MISSPAAIDEFIEVVKRFKQSVTSHLQKATIWDVNENPSRPRNTSQQDDLYSQAASEYAAAIERVARGYEADPEKRRDLAQEIHFALWRSFEHYEARCSTRTWVYRVAHNTAASYVIRQRRTLSKLVTLDELDALPAASDHHRTAEDRLALERLLVLIHQLRPLDRQIMLLYLEDMDAASIGEITGISAGNVRVQIHRIKAILARRFQGRPI